MRTHVKTKRRNRRAGFTLIEVMVSLGIMTIGAMAILSLQQHAIRANVHARQLTIATQIAQRWVERLKQDAHTWNQVATAGNVAAVLTNTKFLKAIVTTPGEYQVFPDEGGEFTPERSFAFDFFGNDTDASVVARPVVYCAAFRPAWVYFGRAMRVDVRVYWERSGAGADFAGDIGPDCDPNNAGQTQLDPGGDLFNEYHIVYLSTVVRMNPVTR